MSEGSTFRLEELLGSKPRCDFLGIEELERWVEGRLEPDRAGAFETHAPGCPDCQELMRDLEQYRELTARGVQVASERRAFDGADPAARRTLGLRSKVRPFDRFRLLASWLVPVGALVLMFWLWPSSRLIPELELPPLQPPPAVRGLDSGEIWKQSAAAWQSGDLATARDALARGVEADPDDDGMRFYLGVAQLHLGDEAQAVESFRTVDAHQAELPSELTRWMLATALDRAGRKHEACDALRSVIEVDGGRAGAAREIVENNCR